MKKLIIVFHLSFFIFHFSFAQQGVVQLPATGQTISYYPGDDGDLQNGVPIPANRFSDNENGTVTDILTGLMWASDANLLASHNSDFDQDRTSGDGEINWRTALDYIQLLNKENYLGFNDWRMPDYLELRSLVNLGNDSMAFPANHPFANVKELYWSSTTPDGRRNAATCVFLSEYYVHSSLTHPVGDFQDMNKNLDFVSNNDYRIYFLPVRSGTETGAIKIPQSGQKLSFYAGDDAAVGAGIEWPSPRFADYNNGTVTDRLTGLMWTKETFPMYNRDSAFYEEHGNGWTSSLDYIAKLNNENYLGYNDWRMPNRNELASLIDCSRNTQNLPKNNPFISTWPFEFIPPVAYWTSSTLARDTNLAWTYSFKLNSAYYVDKTVSRNVWPVRTDNNSIPSGSVNGTIEGAGQAVDKIEIKLEGPVNAYAEVGADGHYSFTVLPEGTYTLTPFHAYIAFTPESKTVVVSNLPETCNFTANYNQVYGWTDISSNLFPLENAAGAGLSDIFFINEDEGWITNSSTAEIYHTTDGGATFEVQTTLYTCSAIYMINASEGYAGGANGFVYRTIDGGKNWNFHGIISSSLTDMDFASPSQGYCCGDHGAVYSITPQGVTNLNSGLATNLAGISSPSENKVWVCGGGTIKYFNGSTWEFQSGPVGTYNAIYFINDNEGWVVGNAQLAGGTNDGGNNFKRIPPHINDMSLYGVHTPNGKDVWAVGSTGTILHTLNGDDFWWNSSQDQGNNVVWRQEGAGLTDAFLRSVFFTSNKNGYVAGNNGTLLKYGIISGDANNIATLVGIQINSVELAEFNTQTYDYAVELPAGTTTIPGIDATLADENATVNITQAIALPGTASIVVTAKDGQTQQTYTVHFTIVTGIGDFELQDKITIYPNPTRGKFKVPLMDAFRMLMEKILQAGNETTEIDVSHLKNGVYFCHLISEKYNATKKLIIQK